VIGFIRRCPITCVIALSLLAIFAYESYQVGWRDLQVGGGLVILPLALQWSVFGPAVQHGEWWRLVAAGFVHFDVLHIGLNLIGLLYAGSFVEPRFGRARTIAVYFGALLIGNVAAYGTTAGSSTVTGGASGAIMGLFGAVGVFAMRYWSQRDQLVYAAGPVIATLLNGFTHSNVSNAAHIGGLLGGIAVALILGPEPEVARAIRTAEERVEGQAMHVLPLPEVPDEIENDPSNRLVLSRSALGKLTFGLVGAVFVVFAAIAMQQSVLGGLFFLAIGVVILSGLRQRLVLSPRGFRSTGTPWGKMIRWRDVARFMADGRGVACLFTPAYVAETDRRSGVLGKLNVGTYARLPSWFGVSPQRQAGLMEEWRARWSSWPHPGLTTLGSAAPDSHQPPPTSDDRQMDEARD